MYVSQVITYSKMLTVFSSFFKLTSNEKANEQVYVMIVFPGKRLLMPSSWSCTSIMSPSPTAPPSTDWAGQNLHSLSAFMLSF